MLIRFNQYFSELWILNAFSCEAAVLNWFLGPLRKGVRHKLLMNILQLGSPVCWLLATRCFLWKGSFLERSRELFVNGFCLSPADSTQK